MEARRLAGLAMGAGIGAAADELILRSDRESLALLGADEDSPLLAAVLRWQGSALRDRGQTSDAEALYRRSLAVAGKLVYEAAPAPAFHCLRNSAPTRAALSSATSLYDV